MKITKANREKQDLIDNIKTMDNIDLLKLFAKCSIKFNPFDYDSIESCEVITGEILRRMKEETKE